MTVSFLVLVVQIAFVNQASAIGVCTVTEADNTTNCFIFNTQAAANQHCLAQPRCQSVATACIVSDIQVPPAALPPNCSDQRAPARPASSAPTVKLQNPLGEGLERTDLRIILGEVIKKALTVLGSLTLLVFIAGGVMWLTSGGSEEKVAKGSKTMLYAVIGIFVIFAAYAILNTVIKTLTGQ